MATANFIAASKKANRQPTVLMSIVDAAGNDVVYTTQGDWQGSTSLTNIDTTTTPGDARQLNENKVSSYVTGTPQGNFLTSSFTTSATVNVRAKAQVFWPSASGNPTLMRLTLRTSSSSTTYITSDQVNVTADGFDSFLNLYYGTLNVLFPTTVALTGSTSIYIRGYDVDDTNPSNPFHPETAPTGIAGEIEVTSTTSSLTTSSFDFGSVPSTSPVFSVDDTKESGASITYTAEGSNTDSWPGTSLGTITDGDSVSPYRYYRVSASFASTASVGFGTISELSFNEGVFRYYGTHQDVPFQGVKPHIIGGSLSPLSQKIDLKKGLSTTGQISVKLAWTRDVADLLATGYLRGKDVQILAGYVGLSSIDYEPVITGTWFDYSQDDKTGEITVQIQDVLKQFEKRKLPLETYNASGVKTSASITYSNTNLIDVIEDIYDKVGIRGRYIDTPSYDALNGAGDPLNGNDWRCTRTLSKPIKATDLLDELAITGGLFLIPTGDGKIKPKLYDATETPTVELDADLLNAKNVKANQKELITRSYHYYNANVSEPSDADNYDNAYALIDVNSETFYDPEKGEKQFFDKWEIGSNAGAALATPPVALSNMASRWNGWWSEPRLSFDFQGMPPRYASIEPGDVVGVTNLTVPIPQDEYDSGTTYDLGDKIVYSGRVYLSLQNANLNKTPSSEPTWWKDEDITATLAPNEFGRGKTDNKAFFVTSRKFDANKATIDLSLVELS